MGDLLIRGLAPATHEELTRRAQDAGLSLQTYVARLLERSTMVPPLADWLSGLDELPRHRAVSGARSVREARDLECGLLTTDQRLARAVPDLATGLNG